MDTLTSFLLNEDSALAFDSFNENVLQNLPHQAGQWDILDPLVPFADTSKYSAGPLITTCYAPPAPRWKLNSITFDEGSLFPLLLPCPRLLPLRTARDVWCQSNMQAVSNWIGAVLPHAGMKASAGMPAQSQLPWDMAQLQQAPANVNPIAAPPDFLAGRIGCRRVS